MENNQQNINTPNHNDFLKMIKAGSPVHKINFDIESPNAVAGMYLIAQKDSKPIIDKIVDKTDLRGDTLLVFESRHVVECCQILCGCLHILESTHLVKHSRNFIINRIIGTLLTRPLFHRDLLTQLNIIATQTIINSSNEDVKQIFQNFKYILDNIWFVPYGEIDELVKTALEEFKNKYIGDDKNEGNG